ncbi:MAG: phytoene desaturase family protein [Planctomycetota bacterium]
MPKAIVIGGGFGGIASALRMRAKGYDVTLIDKQDKLGGRGYQYHHETEHGTFVHDAGPTVITAKFLFDELFELFGKRREDYVEFRDIYPWYRIQFANGEQFNYGGTMEQFEGEIRKFGGDRDVEGFRKYLAHSKRIFDKGFTDLGDQPFDKFTTMLKCAPDLAKLGAWRTVWQMSSKYIKNENLRRVFSFQPLLVGGNPFNTTSIYSLIFYLEREWGVQFAMGGTGAIVRGLQKLMEEEGIELRLGEEVASIDIHDWPDRPKQEKFGLRQWAKSVRLRSGEQIAPGNPGIDPRDVDWEPVVIVNGDPPAIYRNLIAPEHRPSFKDAKLDKMKYSMGLFVLYFGTTRKYDDVAHHTIVLGETYKELLDKLFDMKQVEREDLSVYLHRPTATDPSMAPEGMESFYVLVPVPNLQPGGKADPADIPTHPDGTVDWAKFGDAFRDDVVRYLERTILPGLSECITGDFYVTPDHFRDNLNTHFGSGFSIQPIFKQSAWFRFHNKSEDIDGLYFVGAGTHPGAGMPGVLCSAKVVDNLIPAVEPANAGV